MINKNDPTENQACKIIAYYMDVPTMQQNGVWLKFNDCEFGDLWDTEPLPYSEDFNSLIPVWKKMNTYYKLESKISGKYIFQIGDFIDTVDLEDTKRMCILTAMEIEKIK